MTALKLNEQQNLAVTTNSKHVLILAGAGSGKTKTITQRYIYLIKELGVHPSSILALTFTNKAVKEMKERIFLEIGDDKSLFIKTFHSFGALFLRREYYYSGRAVNFQIYDTDDSKKVVGDVLKKNGYQKGQATAYLKDIREYKQDLASGNFESFMPDFSEIFGQYQEELKLCNAFDFEDLIVEPIKILTEYEEIRYKYRHSFQYLLIDEYQDTNSAQYRLLSLLTDDHTSIMAVGDEDQSIYKFRGADVGIILNFTNDYKNSEIIKLEENYRSTEQILNLANSIISNNQNRIGKRLFSRIKSGDKPVILECNSDFEEAHKIASEIISKKYRFTEAVILVRTNNQTRVFEQVFQQYGIPLRVVGSVSFFQREEIKDVISLIRWFSNSKDRVAFERFVNKPPRGIGAKSLEKFYNHLKDYDGRIDDALRDVGQFSDIPLKARKNLFELASIFDCLSTDIESNPLYDNVVKYLDTTGLHNYYEKRDEEEMRTRLENINEYVLSLKDVPSGKDALYQYLEENALVNLIDENNEGKEAVTIMTVHNAKGLEFDNVFVAGLESGIFPHSRSDSDIEELEEERRLFYVAVTRARHNLYLTYAKQRNLFGRTMDSYPSMFLHEIEPDHIKSDDKTDINRGNAGFKIGDIVKDRNYGKGKVKKIVKKSGKHIAQIDFFEYGMLELVVEFSKLELVYD